MIIGKYRVFPLSRTIITARVGGCLRPLPGASYRGPASVRPHCVHAGKHADASTATKEIAVNKDTVEGNWKQLKGKVKEQWGKLTDDDFDVIAGKRDQLLGRIQERHGISKDEAERQVADWEKSNPNYFFEKS